MILWSEDFVSESTFSKYCSFDSPGDVINAKFGLKGPKLVFNVSMIIERWRFKFEIKYSFSKLSSHNFSVLTPCGDVINPNMSSKGPN